MVFLCFPSSQSYRKWQIIKFMDGLVFKFFLFSFLCRPSICVTKVVVLKREGKDFKTNRETEKKVAATFSPMGFPVEE
jgi:hypothetical protein